MVTLQKPGNKMFSNNTDKQNTLYGRIQIKDLLFENHIIMYKNVYCSPCIYIHIDAPCNGNNICMKNISVDEVFDESLKLIKKI